MHRLILISLLMASMVLLLLAGCETDAQTGTLLGTAIGAGVGQAVGRDTQGTLIGAGAGALGGYIIGTEIEKKKAGSVGTPTTAPTSTDTSTVTVEIPNSNGSFTPVKLRREGAQYVGPKGEYYDHLPTAQELRDAGYGL